MNSLNFYEILNIKTNSTEKEIKKAYRLLAKKYHPDTYSGNKQFAESKMQEINVAYETLSDPRLRTKYDAEQGLNLANEPKSTNYKKTTYSYEEHYRNVYDKPGVNYEVKYKPNNTKTRYNSRGYAEGNYYTYNPDDDIYNEKTYAIKKIKDMLKGKNLIYTVLAFLIVVGIISVVLYKAYESFISLKNVYNEINYSNIDTKKSINNEDKEKLEQEINDSGKEIQEAFNNMVEKLKEAENEISKKYNSTTEEEKKDVLTDWGITDEEEQKAVLDYINNFNKNN